MKTFLPNPQEREQEEGDAIPLKDGNQNVCNEKTIPCESDQSGNLMLSSRQASGRSQCDNDIAGLDLRMKESIESRSLEREKGSRSANEVMKEITGESEVVKGLKKMQCEVGYMLLRQLVISMLKRDDALRLGEEVQSRYGE
tara:strand:+ start:2184 stop:2609 length:426 start_codon:yes stop_codon:yes gene_type:complete